MAGIYPAAQERDLLIIIDFRRYQKGLERFAELATAEASPQIVLLTDQWLSPISRYATHTFTISTDVGTVWDSYATTLALIEAAIVVVSERDWAATRKRMGVWDRLRPDPQPSATEIRTISEDEIE